MTRSLRIRGLPGQLQLGRESRTFSGEGPATWPSPQDIRDKSQGNLTGKKPVSRENGAVLGAVATSFDRLFDRVQPINAEGCRAAPW